MYTHHRLGSGCLPRPQTTLFLLTSSTDFRILAEVEGEERFIVVSEVCETTMLAAMDILAVNLDALWIGKNYAYRYGRKVEAMITRNLTEGGFDHPAAEMLAGIQNLLNFTKVRECSARK